MFEKLKALEDKFNEINEKLMQPETVNNTSLYTSLMKEYKTLTPTSVKTAQIRTDNFIGFGDSNSERIVVSLLVKRR